MRLKDLVFLTRAKRRARKELPSLDDLVKNPPQLAQAIDASRINGSSESLRLVLVDAGKWRFPDNVPLLAARKRVLENDPSRRVREAALISVSVNALRTLGTKTYPFGAREAMSVALNDSDSKIRKFAESQVRLFEKDAIREGFQDALETEIEANGVPRFSND